MSFYSYKNANPRNCPSAISGDALSGLNEKVCIQVKRVYDSGLIQEQLDDEVVTITSYAVVPPCSCTCGGNCCQGELPDPPTRDLVSSHLKAAVPPPAPGASPS